MSDKIIAKLKKQLAESKAQHKKKDIQIKELKEKHKKEIKRYIPKKERVGISAEKLWYKPQGLKYPIKKNGPGFNKLVKGALIDIKANNISGLYRLLDLNYQFDNNDFYYVDKMLNDLAAGQNILIKVETMNGNIRYFTYTNRSKMFFKILLRNKYFEEEEIEVGSDRMTEITREGIKKFIVFFTPKEVAGRKMFNKNGKFFKYINETDIDLTRYQIIGPNDDVTILKEHCLIHTLRLQEVDEDILNQIMLNFEKGVHFPKSNLHQVSELLGRNIELHCLKTDNITMIEYYGNNENIETFKIILYKEHYFIYEQTEFTEYSIKNYENVRNEKEFNLITKIHNDIPFKGKNSKKINSFKLIKMLFDQGYFTENNKILRAIDDYQKYETDILDIPLTNIENEQREYKCKVKEDEPMDIYYADLETDTTDNHKCIMAGICKLQNKKSGEEEIEYENDNDNTQTFMNNQGNDKKAFNSMLDYIVATSTTKKIVVYFHNLKYDYNVFKSLAYHTKMCEKGGQIYSGEIIHNKRKIEVRDSYKLTNIALSKFQETYALDKELNKKEAIGYTYYKTNNIYNNSKHTSVPIKEYLKHVKKSEWSTFYSVVKSEKFDYDDVNKTFNPIKYYQYYLKYDVMILKEGMIKMHKIVKDLCNINMYNFLTISSLTNYYMAQNGAFENMYEVNGNLREFLSRGIYGGRVDVNQKYKKKVLRRHIVDYDATSLYPSAIIRLCREMGLAIGKCKRIISKNKQDLDEKSYYVVAVKITKINKKQQIPFIRYVDEYESNVYTNEIKQPEGLTLVIDKITLEDYIKFHDIEYEIIDGVEWNQGFNKKMGELITKLFEDRQKYKKDGNDAMQNTIKLMLNSAYGKTIMKKSKTRKVFRKNDEKDDYIVNNFNNIHKIDVLSKSQYIIEIDKYDDSYNLAHVGILILSYSKRIMNEVMDLASNNDIVIYYQDTDSMHMNREDVPKLEKLYKEKYGKDLTGKNTEQFHTDFELKKEGAVTEVYSILSIFLGKKCYLDKLESTDKDGKIIHGYHLRMKGIPEAALEKSLIYYQSYEHLYEYLANDGKHNFELNPNEKVFFEFTNSGVHTKERFHREVDFISNEDKKRMKKFLE